MARYRQPERRWVHAACVAGAYLVLVASLFTLHLGAGLGLPVSVALAAPPLVYALLAIVLLRDASFVRRLSWIGGACLVHLLLAMLAAVELTWAGGLSLPVALAQVFVLFPPAPVLTVVATPLTLAAFGLTAQNPPRRPEPSSRPTAPRSKPIGPAVRAARSMPEAAAPAPAAPRAMTPLGGAAAPKPAPTPSPPRPPAAPVAPVAPAAAAAMPPAYADVAPPAPVVSPPARPSARRADDGMVRVSFARIAGQLPAEAFVLPFERLSESLREPHTVLVPRRVVLSQLRDGAVAVTWAHIASQFPDLALGMSDDEFRKQYADLKLWLPIDELVPQLPAGTFPGAASAEPVRIESAPAPLVSASNGGSAASIAPAPVLISTPSATAPSHPELLGRDVLERIAACFAGLGVFECAAGRLDDTTVVTLIGTGLGPRAVTLCAGPVVRSLAGAEADVVTLRTEHAVLIVAVAPTPVVVAARLPGAPVALLGLRAVRAAATVGTGAPSLPFPRRRALEPVGGDARVADAGRALRSLRAGEPTVFTDGPARVYVFSAGVADEKAVAAALALDVCEALGNGGDLGRPRAVLFRRGDVHTLVRPLAGPAGVLVVTGPITRPGRLLREAERAASVLEAM